MRPSPLRRSVLLAFLSGCFLAFLVACATGSAPDEGDGGNGDGDDNELEASLNRLGVDTTCTGRVGPDGEPLPDSFRPLGASASYGHGEAFRDDGGMHPTDELLVLGAVVDDAVSDGRLALVEKEGVQVSDTGAVDAVSLTAEVSDVASGDVDGDVDGDGLDELVLGGLTEIHDDCRAYTGPRDRARRRRAGVRRPRECIA